MAAPTVIVSELRPRLERRKLIGGVAYVFFLLAIFIGLAGLASLLIRVLWEGVPWLSCISSPTTLPASRSRRA